MGPFYLFIYLLSMTTSGYILIEKKEDIENEFEKLYKKLLPSEKLVEDLLLRTELNVKYDKLLNVTTNTRTKIRLIEQHHSKLEKLKQRKEGLLSKNKEKLKTPDADEKKL